MKNYDVICDDSPDGFHVEEATEESKKEFRAARIAYGWVPENPSYEERLLIEEHQKLNKVAV